ncbi:MFS transporter [Shimazuella sp. AN120528]|nr:MFS transporter [Shimazuella soli]
MPAWFQKMGYLSVLGLVMGVTIGATLVGGLSSGPLLDRFGIRKVQGASLGIMLVNAVWTAYAQEWIEMMILQSVRDFVCAIGIVACGMRARAILSQNQEEQIKGLGKLNIWSYAASATFAWLGPILVTHNMVLWKWLGAIITFIGLLEVVLNKQPVQIKTEKKNIENFSVWDWDILKLVLPAIGVSIIQGVVNTFIIVDAGVNLGSPVRAAMNIAAGLAGIIVPYMVKKWGDKLVIRSLMSLVVIAVLCLIWPTWYILVFVGLSIGLAQMGINIILTVKRPNTGRSASMHSLVDYGGAAFSSIFWGTVRQLAGITSSYALLLIPALLCFFAFERLFRSKRWLTQE